MVKINQMANLTLTGFSTYHSNTDGGWWRWAMVSPYGVATSRMVCVPASVNLPLHLKVQKFSSGTGLPGWSRKRAIKRLCVCVCVQTQDFYSHITDKNFTCIS